MFEVKVITDVQAEPVTLDEIKAFCRLDADYTQEDLILELICASAREKLEGWLNIYLAPKEVEIEFSYPVFELPYGPAGEITGLVRIIESDSPYTEPVTEYHTEGLDFKKLIITEASENGHWWYPINGGIPQWQGHIERCEKFIVSLTTGYVVLPALLKHALLIQIDYDYKAQGAPQLEALSPMSLQKAEQFSKNLVL